MIGHTNFYVRTVDTDVVAILIGKFHCLVAFCQSLNIWVAFGAGKHFTYYHINTICQKLGTERSIALPVFHSFTGCDTTSSFYGKGNFNNNNSGEFDAKTKWQKIHLNCRY